MIGRELVHSTRYRGWQNQVFLHQYDSSRAWKVNLRLSSPKMTVHNLRPPAHHPIHRSQQWLYSLFSLSEAMREKLFIKEVEHGYHLISRQARKCKSENYDPKCISYAFLEINGGFISTWVWEMLHKVHLRDIIMLLVCTRVSKHDTYVLFCFFIIFYYQRNSFPTRDSRQLESEVECIIYIEQKIDCEGIIIMQCGHQMIGMGTWKRI